MTSPLGYRPDKAVLPYSLGADLIIRLKPTNGDVWPTGTTGQLIIYDRESSASGMQTLHTATGALNGNGNLEFNVSDSDTTNFAANARWYRLYADNMPNRALIYYGPTERMD